MCCALCPVAKDPRAAEQWHQMCRVGAGWTAVPTDGQLGHSWRHEQPRQLCLCRHAAAASPHSPASEPRVRLLGRRSGDSALLAACCAPVALARLCGSSIKCYWTRESMLAAATACWLRSVPPTRTVETRSRCSWVLRASRELCVSVRTRSAHAPRNTRTHTYSHPFTPSPL